MSALLLVLAYAALIAWPARAPSEALFADALSYLAAAERWERRLSVDRECEELDEFVRHRAECLATGQRLARKAIRRMPWRLI